jgi:preprotein translocase subunit SecD
MEFKKLLFNVRVIILFIFLLLSLFAINPRPFNEGVSIRSIELNSSASQAGMVGPKPTATPLSREKIVSIDATAIKNAEDYYAVVETLTANDSVQIKTNKGSYRLVVKDRAGVPDLGLVVLDAPKSNIRKGLDLQGGTRIILEPQEKLSDADLEILLLNMNERLNVFGLSDVTIRPTSDLQGNRFIVIEVSGGNDEEVKSVIARQGKFEARVGNVTVFRGGQDVTYVCRSAECSGLSPYRAPTQAAPDQWSSVFQFSISLSTDSAKHMADATRDLAVVGQYLSQPISLYLDDQLVDELQISSGLRGQVVTDIAISGPGVGRTQQESQLVALQNMKRLQTILITGSLPVKLNIVKTDTISPVLGSEFTKSAILMIIMATVAVSVVIFFRYRKLSVSIPIMITLLSEIIITLGIAALIGWNIDVAAIAGLLAAVGTGVDDQIVIMDETTSRRSQDSSWIKRMKNAFFIIFAAYFAGVASMIPLLFAGAGLLKGFAITSIIGISVGVFITRPAFAAIAEQLYKEE